MELVLVLYEGALSFFQGEWIDGEVSQGGGVSLQILFLFLILLAREMPTSTP